MPFPVDEKWIKEAESKLDVIFPHSYRSETSNENGGHLTINDETWDLYPIWDKSDRKRLKRTCNDIVHETEVCNDCVGFPPRAVAIATNRCGDQLILLPEEGSTKLKETIYFWSHETGVRLRKMYDHITKNIHIPALLLALLLTGCSNSKFGYFSTAIIHPIRPHIMELSDGFKAEYYSFTLGDKKATDTYIFYITGSGHASVQFCRHYLKSLPGNVKVFALQKRYVTHWTTGMFESPKGFHETHFFTNWKKDQIEFIKKILFESSVRAQRIVVFGVSEGSAVASAVTASIPQITHLVSIGEGGMKGIDSFRIWGRKHNVDFDQVYRLVSSNPTTSKLIDNYSYRWWKETLDVDPMQFLRTIEIPIFFVMGEKDDMVPIESLYFLQNEFKRLNKRNLTVKIYSDCNHRLIDLNGKSHRHRFFVDMVDWWNRT